MKNPIKQACKKAAKVFKKHTRCKPVGDDSFAALVSYKGEGYRVLITKLDDSTCCVQIPEEEQS